MSPADREDVAEEQAVVVGPLDRGDRQRAGARPAEREAGIVVAEGAAPAVDQDPVELRLAGRGPFAESRNAPSHRLAPAPVPRGRRAAVELDAQLDAGACLLSPEGEPRQEDFEERMLCAVEREQRIDAGHAHHADSTG
jgi:hypothetical protein